MNGNAMRRLFPTSRLGELEARQLPLALTIFALAYIVGTRIGLISSLPPSDVVIVWVPNAIVMVVLLHVRRQFWPLFATVGVAAEAVAFGADISRGIDAELTRTLGYGVLNVLEATVVAYWLHRSRQGKEWIRGRNDFLRYLFIGPVATSAAVALGGAALIKWGLPEADYLHYWRVYWFGNALGLLLIGMPLLIWLGRKSSPASTPRPSQWETAILAVALAATCVWTLVLDRDTSRIYLLFPLLIWAAVRFRPRGASVSVALTALIAICAAASGHGPFVSMSSIDNALSLQGLVGVVAVSTYLLAFAASDAEDANEQLRDTVQRLKAAQAELQQTNKVLSRTNDGLDAAVEDRTRELRAALANNEMLMKELHHRVKNNLQLVSSLVSLQGRSFSDPLVRSRFASIEGQIAAIARTYDIMHGMEQREEVDFGRFVPALCEALAGGNAGRAKVTCEVGDAAPVLPSTVVALALALNELVTNSMKHGAASEHSIRVWCRREGDQLALCVEDNGPGFPPNFDIETATSFGMKMVRNVIAQEGGSLMIVPSDAGARVQILVPLAAA